MKWSCREIYNISNELTWKTQASILGPPLFLIHINYLSDNLASNPKLFSDDNQLFYIFSAINLNIDLDKINN